MTKLKGMQRLVRHVTARQPTRLRQMRARKKGLAVVFEPLLYGVSKTSSHFGPDGEAILKVGFGSS